MTATIDPMAPCAFRYAPLIVFGVVYTLGCLIGALLLIADYTPFVALFEYFSGTVPPQLSPAETRTNLILLGAAPLVLAGGYVAATELPFRRLRVARQDIAVGPPSWLPVIVFTLLALAGLVSLIRAGALNHTGSWLDYGAWVRSRAENSARVSFLEFANLYILIPTAAAWVVVTMQPTSRAHSLVRWVPVPIALVLSVFLYTRKALLTVLLIVLFAWIVDAVARGRHVRRFVLSATAVVAAAYLVLVVVPVYSESSRTANQAADVKIETDPERARRLKRIAAEYGLGNRQYAIALYALLSPLTRSSAPALYYPEIFPDEYDFFRLDLGLDILGVGAMPNDNVVVWNYINPETPGGQTAVPYQFVLYSQIGTFGAVAASFIVGLLLALAWRLSQVPARTTAALLGSMVLLLATYLGIDSLRNGLVVSYGVIWGVLFAGAAAATARLVVSLTRHVGDVRARDGVTSART